MTEQDYVKRRMDHALDKAIDMAEEKAKTRGVHLPPEMIGQLALAMFRSQMALAMRQPEQYDVPEDDLRGSY